MKIILPYQLLLLRNRIYNYYYSTWSSAIYSEGYAVWIDYNQNGVFTDAENKFGLSSFNHKSCFRFFTIPATATLGATRMRVSMKYNGIPTACEAFPYGQVEDYTVKLALVLLTLLLQQLQHL
jgi:hypothetical protein